MRICHTQQLASFTFTQNWTQVPDHVVAAAAGALKKAWQGLAGMIWTCRMPEFGIRWLSHPFTDGMLLLGRSLTWAGCFGAQEPSSACLRCWCPSLTWLTLEAIKRCHLGTLWNSLELFGTLWNSLELFGGNETLVPEYKQSDFS